MTLSMDGHGPAVLHATPETGPHGVRLRLAGELDVATAGHLVEIARSLPDHHLHEVVLDVSGLAFVDAAGLSALLRTKKVVHHRGGRLVLQGPAPILRRMLAVTGLESSFDVRTDSRLRSTPDRPGRVPASG